MNLRLRKCILSLRQTSNATSGSLERLFWTCKGNFQCVRDSLSRIKLSRDLKLNDSRQGILRADQPLLNVIAGRCNEMLTKLLTIIEPGNVLSQETLD